FPKRYFTQSRKPKRTQKKPRKRKNNGAAAATVVLEDVGGQQNMGQCYIWLTHVHAQDSLPAKQKKTHIANLTMNKNPGILRATCFSRVLHTRYVHEFLLIIVHV